MRKKKGVQRKKREGKEGRRSAEENKQSTVRLTLSVRAVKGSRARSGLLLFSQRRVTLTVLWKYDPFCSL